MRAGSFYKNTRPAGAYAPGRGDEIKHRCGDGSVRPRHQVVHGRDAIRDVRRAMQNEVAAGVEGLHGGRQIPDLAYPGGGQPGQMPGGLVRARHMPGDMVHVLGRWRVPRDLEDFVQGFLRQGCFLEFPYGAPVADQGVEGFRRRLSRLHREKITWREFGMFQGGRWADGHAVSAVDTVFFAFRTSDWIPLGIAGQDHERAGFNTKSIPLTGCPIDGDTGHTLLLLGRVALFCVHYYKP